MDMARKFLQMGSSRARRHANHKTGRKYEVDKGAPVSRRGQIEGRISKALLRAVAAGEKDQKYLELKRDIAQGMKLSMLHFEAANTLPCCHR
jgi:Domain of unknown function (DUF4385)